MSPAPLLRAIKFGAAAVAVLAGSLFWAAGPAAAADTLEFSGNLFPEVVSIDLDDAGTPIPGVNTGALTAIVGGEQVVAYCIDFDLAIDVGDVLGEVPWEDVTVPNLDTVAAIITGYDATDPAGDPAGFEITGSGPVRSASIQAAVWYFTNGLTTTGPADVAANVATILAAVDAGVLPTAADVAPSVQITGPTEPTTLGSVAGPFVVTGSPVPIALTPGADTELVTWPDGDPLVGPVDSGTEFGLVRTTEGTATVQAETPTVMFRNQVFSNGTIQPLMLIDPPLASATAQAAADFVPPPTTTTTTEPPTTTTEPPTTTTEPPTTTTVAGEVGGASSTTVTAVVQGARAERPTQAVAAQAVATQSLPNTGSSTGLLVAGAVVLMAAGAGLLAAARQPATAETGRGRHRRTR